jgi:protein MpaA
MTPTASGPSRLAGLLVATAIVSACAVSPPRRPVAPAPVPLDPLPPAASAHAWKAIGRSVEGRPLLVAQSGTGPVRVYVIGGVHGDETEGRTVLDTLGRQRRVGATLRVLRDLNPDGTAAYRRANARGLDLNRNWPARNFQPGATGGDAPLSEPETRALHQELRAFRPQLVVVLHSMSGGPLVNYDGPAERHATAFANAARSVSPDWRVEPDMGYPTSGSLGSWLGVDQRVPVLTIEFRRGQDEASATAALHKGLAAVIRTAHAQTP